jgi:hypothetical protein
MFAVARDALLGRPRTRPDPIRVGSRPPTRRLTPPQTPEDAAEPR